MKRKLLSLITAVMIAVNAVPCVSLASETERISSEKDLLEFLDKCTGDSYSKGRDFILTTDIDLRGKKIDSASVFCGSFDGGGHTIKNYEMEFTGDDYAGFFHKLAEGANVVNLTLSGNMRKTESETNGLSADEIRGELEKNLGITTESTAVDGASFGVQRHIDRRKARGRHCRRELGKGTYRGVRKLCRDKQHLYFRRNSGR